MDGSKNDGFKMTKEEIEVFDKMNDRFHKENPDSMETMIILQVPVAKLAELEASKLEKTVKEMQRERTDSK